MPGSLGHLVRRFFDVLTAKPLSEGEVHAVESWLAPPLQELFFAQHNVDQRHGYQCALTFMADGSQSRELVIAALVHDVGKRHAHLGILGRTVASLMILMRMPLTNRFNAYRDHGTVAATELAERGASPLVVDFALHHHSDRPPSIDGRSWTVLVAADQPPNTLFKRDVGISSVTP